jgi:hypothetical protein
MPDQSAPAGLGSAAPKLPQIRIVVPATSRMGRIRKTVDVLAHAGLQEKKKAPALIDDEASHTGGREATVMQHPEPANGKPNAN